MARNIKAVLLLALFSTQAYAYSSSSSGDSDHLVSVGEGISSPSAVSALSENPAGLVYSKSFSLLGEVSSGNDQFSPLGFGGGFLAGNGSVGGGIVVNGSATTQGGLSGGAGLMQFGIATELSSLNMAWGFSGSFSFATVGTAQNVGYGNSPWGLDTGVIFNPKSQTRFGVTLYNLLDGIDAVGGGVSYDPSQSATLTLDGTYSRGTQTGAVKPGMAIRLPAFQMSAGYGFRVVGDGTGWFASGFSLGLGIPFSQKFALQAYYNQLSLYYAGLTVTL